jgi:hypothetical protein
MHLLLLLSDPLFLVLLVAAQVLLEGPDPLLVLDLLYAGGPRLLRGLVLGLWWKYGVGMGLG